VFKALAARRSNESVAYNHVVRDFLKLPAPKPTHESPGKGAHFKGVFFPEGTDFRATYKGRTYTAQTETVGGWTLMGRQDAAHPEPP
jgi:hypothetical protein